MSQPPSLREASQDVFNVWVALVILSLIYGLWHNESGVDLALRLIVDPLLYMVLWFIVGAVRAELRMKFRQKGGVG